MSYHFFEKFEYKVSFYSLIFASKNEFQKQNLFSNNETKPILEISKIIFV
jgi:hypothetical protein